MGKVKNYFFDEIVKYSDSKPYYKLVLHGVAHNIYDKLEKPLFGEYLDIQKKEIEDSKKYIDIKVQKFLLKNPQ